jgi:hypothetical protein
MYPLNNNCFNTIYNIGVVTKFFFLYTYIYHEKILNYKRISCTLNHVFEKSGLCHSLQVQCENYYKHWTAKDG